MHSSYPFAKARLRNLANIINIKRPKEGASVLFKKVFPPKDIIALRYPVSISSPKIILYYIVYLFQNALDYGLQIFRLMRGNKEISISLCHERELEILCDWMASN